LIILVGVIDKDAWCKDNRKNLYVLDVNGLYRIPYPLGRAEALVDEDVMPTFTDDLNLNPQTQRITLGFDPGRKQILISVSNIQDGTNTNYIYDLVTQGFFPEKYPDDCSPYSLHFYNADEPEYRQLLVGCSDGYLRIFDDSAKNDDDGTAVPVAIDSYVLLGPTQIGRNVDTDGKTREFTFLTAGGAAGGSIGDSSDLDYEIFFADNAEEIIEMQEAAERDPLFEDTVSAPGRSYRETLKGSGVFMGVRIGNETAGETWGIERVTVEVDDAGRTKKL